jgi:hypothetical protein
MNVTDRVAVSKALARTHGGDRDGWVRVEEYQRVLEHTADHPNQGSAAVSAAVGLPRGRIRPWVDDGARPDPVRTIQRAEGHGWLDLDWRAPPFTGLNVLVAWIFSGGSVNRSFMPRFSIGDADEDERLSTAFGHLGIDYRIIERGGRHGREAEPTTAATTLGRLLVALGAPQGTKHRDATLSLPDYLGAAPFPTRLDFARTYVQNRGVLRPDNPKRPIQIREERSDTYRAELSRYLRDVAGADAAVVGSPVLYLSQRAAAMFCAEMLAEAQ